MSNADLIAEARGQVKGVMKDDGYGYIVPARDIATVNALLERLADALEAQPAPPTQSVQDAIDLLDGHYGDEAIQYHAYASLHDAIHAIAQPAPLVADSREALGDIIRPYIADEYMQGQVFPGDEAVLDEILASGVVSVAGDRDRVVAERAWDEGFVAAVNYDMGDYEHPPEEYTNPYRESEARND